MDTSAEHEISQALGSGLLSFGGEETEWSEDYMRSLNPGHDLSKPIKLSATKHIHARLVGTNAYLISTPRKLFSFSRRDVYQHYLGMIYRTAHTSPSKPRRRTFEPALSPPPLSPPVPASAKLEPGAKPDAVRRTRSNLSGKMGAGDDGPPQSILAERGYGSFSPSKPGHTSFSPCPFSGGGEKSQQASSSDDVRRQRSQSMEPSNRDDRASNRTLISCGFSPYVCDPGNPKSILEHELGDILRHCDKNAIEKMLALADSCPEPAEGMDEQRKDLIKSVRSLQTLAEVQKKRAEEADGDSEDEINEKYFLNDELKTLCKKRIMNLSFVRDWQGEKALRDYHNATGQFKIKTLPKKVYPSDSKGIPRATSWTKKTRDNSSAVQGAMVNSLDPTRPLSAPANRPPGGRAAGTTEAPQAKHADPHAGLGLLTLNELIDIDQSIYSEDDRVHPSHMKKNPATAIYDTDVLNQMCVDLEESSDYITEGGRGSLDGQGGTRAMVAPVVTSLYDEDILDEICNMINESKDKKAAEPPGNRSSKPKQYGHIEFSKPPKSREERLVPILSSSSRPASSRPATSGGRKSAKKNRNRPQSAAPATTSPLLPSGFSNLNSHQSQQSHDEFFHQGIDSLSDLNKANSMTSTTDEMYNREASCTSPSKLSPKNNYTQIGGNGIIYREQHSIAEHSIRTVVDVNSPVKCWKSKTKS
jgi:hypothetical protein